MHSKLGIDDLVRLGLRKKEASVYLAMLQLGPVSVQKIATISNVNRVTTYRYLSDLQAKGLVDSIQKGKRTRYFARDPRTLQQNLEDKEKQVKKTKQVLANLMPQLQAMYHVDRTKPVVMYYEGDQGFIDTFDYMLGELKRLQADCYRIFSQQRATLYGFFQRLDPQFIKRRQRFGVKCMAISTDGYLEEYRDIGQIDFEENTERRTIAREFYFGTFQYILPESVIVFSLDKDHYVGAVIQHPGLAETQKILFDFIWKYAKPCV